jgi:hypothetical protein
MFTYVNSTKGLVLNAYGAVLELTSNAIGTGWLKKHKFLFVSERERAQRQF